MATRILVPLDGSAFAEAALPAALALAERDGAALELLTVVPPPVPPVYLEGAAALALELYDQAASAAAEYVESTRARIAAEAPGIEVRGATLRGAVVDSIDQEARERGVDLIVMASHGRGPFQRMWLGSVADGVLRHAPAAVLLLRPTAQGEDAPTPPLAFPTVLLPIDGSPTAREIVPDAISVAGPAARFHVLRILLPHAAPRPGVLPDPLDIPPDPEDDRSRAGEALGSAEESLRALGAEEVSTELVEADHAAAAIVDHVEAHPVSLVAMSTHGEGGVARLLLGSTADKVARAVQCPILLHRVPARRASD